MTDASQPNAQSAPAGPRGKAAPIQMSGETALLARRYASALYDLARDQKTLPQVEADVKSLLNGINSSPDLQEALAHPRLPRDKIGGVLAALAQQMNAHTITQNFLGVVSRNGRARNLADIVHAFLAHAAAKRGEQTALVTSAQPLSTAQETALIAQLQQASGQKVSLQIRHDPELLGGMTVKLGSKLYDGSLQGQLSRLMRTLKEAA